MAEAGVQIYVIKADPVRGSTPSPWTSDATHPNIRVTSLPRTYPLAVSHSRSGLMGKLAFKWHTSRLGRMTRGTIYDISVGWEKSFRQTADKLVKSEKITHVIATGAPFHLLTETARIKDRFPYLTVLCDYRDPWITGINYGMPQLAPKRMQFEKDLQHEMFMKADIVTAVNPSMLAEIKESNNRLNEARCRFEVIPHFYDQADIPTTEPVEQKPDDIIRLVYGGALYMGLESHFERINLFLTKLQSVQPQLYARLQFDIFTSDLRFAHFVKAHSGVVRLQPPIGKVFFDKVAGADFAVVFSAHHNKDYLTTKFMEYLPQHKPMLHIGDEGFCRQFILDHRLGLTWETLEEMLLTRQADFPSFNRDYPAERHETRQIAAELMHMMAL